jgi:hypothetical protein
MCDLAFLFCQLWSGIPYTNNSKGHRYFIRPIKSVFSLPENCQYKIVKETTCLELHINHGEKRIEIIQFVIKGA